LIKQLTTLCCLIFLVTAASAQFTTVSGTIYDITARRPLEAVAVLSTSGRGTITDSAGRYSLTVKKTDSIWFSLIGKTTMKYAVDTISNLSGFDVMLHIKATQLPEVTVRNRYYRFDSIQNRNDYAKVFNFRKPSLQIINNPTYNTTPGVTAGLDINEIINMFRFKRNRQILALQRRLLQQEQDAYIDHRFKKIFVIKLTGLSGAALDSFMVAYRPDYEFLLTLNDLEFGYYIERCFDLHKQHKPSPFKGLYKKDEDME
jgi:hypothetical protein